MHPRPRNHVTDAMALGQAQKPALLPAIEERLLAALEATYPPRCLEPRETVEDHLRYAGKVELIARLRQEHNERLQASVEEDDLSDPSDIMTVGERAS